MSVELRPYAAVPDETITRNQDHARSLGLKKVQFPPPHQEDIAIVGGGRSIYDKWDELRKFRHILAINNTRNVLLNFGIDATFISVDPLPVVAEFAKGANRAIVATRCDPSVFEVLKGAVVRVFDTPGDITMRSCTASTFVPLCFKMGFRKVYLFGVESCYKGFSHADRHEDREVIKVRADGREWITAGDYYIQAQELAADIRSNPGIVIEKSGGLLRAIVRDTKHEAIEVGKLCLSD